MGGRERLLGVNPFGIAIPGDEKPIVLDVATSIVAVGRAHMKHVRKEKIPDGWFLDSQGNPTTRFEDFTEGGSILPFGTYKGYGIALIIEILAGILTEANRNGEFKIARKAGVLMAAIDIKGFTHVNEFKESVGNLIRKIKSSKKRSGIDEILVPGELEFEAKKKREKEGIFIEELLENRISYEKKALYLFPTNEYTRVTLFEQKTYYCFGNHCRS